MQCFCATKKTYDLKIEGDVGADPIWCQHCGCNLELEDLPLSEEVKSQLEKWAGKYGEWIDWEQDQLVSNGIEMEALHNKEGLILTEKVKDELGEKYRLSFSPAMIAKRYRNSL